jgi:hypothetical protein
MLNELRILRRLSHPNVAHFHGACVAGEDMYLAPSSRREYTMNMLIFLVECFYILVYLSAGPPHFSRSGGLSTYSTELFDELLDNKYSTTFWGLPVTRCTPCGSHALHLSAWFARSSILKWEPHSSS